ncbi:uncharacterized protein LOC103466246 [Poecilia reticulata]|uniref:uncharacterized protein LOC103466246 n=1 Tax=Poecilia reticulata TaxID=8081 RepID=UPI0004A338FC|nr:PREDICTED: uncharacterized protein LOC103466246 [Poecilia reticulata]
MNSLLLDESHHEPETEKLENPQDSSNKVGTGNETRHISKSGAKKTSEKDTVPGGVSLLTRVLRMAHRGLLSPLGRQGVEEKCSQTLAVPRHQSPGCMFRRRASASFTQAQVRLKRQSKQKSSIHQPAGQGSSGEVAVAPVTGTKPAGCGKSERYQQTFERSGTGSVGKVTHRRSNHTIRNHARAKSHCLPQNEKSSVDQNPNSSVILSSTIHSSPQPTSASQSGEPHETFNAALIRELSSRHQTGLPFTNARESKLI